MSSSNIHVISPATKEHWQSQFIGSATSLDESGFPLSGSFGVSFSCPCNLAEPEGESLQERMVAAISTTQPGWTPRKVADSVRRLLDIYAALQPDTVVAFKEGKTIVAFVRILGPYFYEPTNPVSHRWNYKTIRKATPTEAHPPNAGGLIPTFLANYIPAPLFEAESTSTNTVIEEAAAAPVPAPAPAPATEEPTSPPAPAPAPEEPTSPPPPSNWPLYVGVAAVAIAITISIFKKRRPQ